METVMKWNIEGVVKGFQNIYLLEEDFQYTPTLLNGECHITYDEIEYDEV